MDDAGESLDPEEGFRRIYWSYAPVVRSFFLQRAFTEEEAADLTQEVFLRVHQSLGGFRGEGELGTWLFQVTANVYKNELRSRNTLKRAAVEVSIEEAPGERESDTDDALAALLAGERSGLLQSALEELPPQMRRCVELRFHRDLKYREIAVLLGISIDTVKAHLHQARQLLRSKLGGQFAAPGRGSS